MKRIVQLLTTSCFAVLVVSSPLIAAGKEDNKAPVGSIRPSGEVKPENLPGLAKISFEAALKIALARAPGAAIKAELEVEDGNLMYSFEIVGKDKRITEVEVDAGNGKILNVEDESAENEKE